MCGCKGWPPVLDSDANELGTSLYNGVNGDARESDSKNRPSSLLLETHTEARRLAVILLQGREALNVTVQGIAPRNGLRRKRARNIPL